MHNSPHNNSRQSYLTITVVYILVAKVHTNTLNQVTYAWKKPLPLEGTLANVYRGKRHGVLERSPRTCSNNSVEAEKLGGSHNQLKAKPLLLARTFFRPANTGSRPKVTSLST